MSQRDMRAHDTSLHTTSKKFTMTNACGFSPYQAYRTTLPVKSEVEENKQISQNYVKYSLLKKGDI
jgi:hypothetical protein